MENAFFSEERKTPEALLTVWREADRRSQRTLERLQVAGEAEQILQEGGTRYVSQHRLTRVLDLQTSKGEGTPGALELADSYRAVEVAVEEAQDILKAQGIDLSGAGSKLEDAYLSGCFTPQSLADYWISVLEDKRLREQKQRERHERREREDEFIRAMAPAFAAGRGLAAPPRRADLRLIGNSAPDGSLACQDPEDVLEQIHEVLSGEPWLRHLIVRQEGWPNLLSSEDGLHWQEKCRSFPVSSRTDKARMAALADAYGPVVDWNSPWHIIRPRLLTVIKSKELDLLHRADVLAALDRARQVGKELVVFGHVAYQWVDGEWRLREVVRRDRNGRSPGATLWVQGPIVSRNYGRIIILPFIKSDGTENSGYTRNSPYEGEAPPRAEPKLIPFEVYARNGRDDTWVHSGDIVVPDSEMVALR
ncbi:MAG TPA: hypothetical protein VIL69_14965 [Roseomonas sp.]|jgi:hypothetical protein